MKLKNILIVITSGRPLACQKSINSLCDNIIRWRPKVKNIDFLINYDLSFNNTTQEEFKRIALKKNGLIGQLDYAGNEFINSAQWLNNHEKSLLSKISKTVGYGQKKNACLLYALKNNYDNIIFLDDDEYAQYVINADGKDQWQSSDFIGAHAIDNSDITFGYLTGYVSPIPKSFFKNISEETKKSLTLALMPISDVVDRKTFFEESEIYYIPSKTPRLKKEILEIKGGKWISGGNFGVNLQSVRKNKVPAFYTPLASRGEDSIYSVSLARTKSRVFEVPAGIFHDAFGDYLEVDLSIPYSAMNNTNKEEATLRFARVLKGWIAYSPLLSALCDPSGYKNNVLKSCEELKKCDHELLEFFGEKWAYNKPSVILLEHLDLVEKEMSEFEDTQNIWMEIYSLK